MLGAWTVLGGESSDSLDVSLIADVVVVSVTPVVAGVGLGPATVCTDPTGAVVGKAEKVTEEAFDVTCGAGGNKDVAFGLLAGFDPGKTNPLVPD